MDIVEVKNICKTYQAFQMKDVSFSLEEGRITGFIGRNGAGKSTTIKAMLNLIHTDSGKIFYFGMPLAGNEAKIKQRIGYSTGAASWFPRKTIKKIVSTTKSFYSNWDEDAYHHYMAMFGLNEGKKLMEVFQILKEHGVTIFFLTHIISDLERCADNIILENRMASLRASGSGIPLIPE